MRTADRPLRWSFLVALFVAAFGLNWPWEMLQMPGYVEMAGRPWRATALVCTRATFGDAAVTLGVYQLVALASRRRRSVKDGWRLYAAAALLGAVCAVVIEWVSLGAGHWSYTDRMPVVPGLDVGLWPLLQLTLLVPAALRAAVWWDGYTQNGDEEERT